MPASETGISYTSKGAFRGRCAPPAGFTFIELLMVVAIISLLSAIAMPAYRDYVLRAQVAEALNFLGYSKVAVNEFYSRWGRMPADNAEAGLRSPDVIRGNYVRSVTVTGGVIVAAMVLGSGQGVENSLERTLTFRPWLNAATSSAPIFWSCNEGVPVQTGDYRALGEVAADRVEDRFLPTVCRAPTNH